MSYSLIGPVVPLRGGIAHYTTLLAKELQKRSEVSVISFSRLYPDMLFPGKSQRDEHPSLEPPANVEYCIDSLNPLTWRRAAKRIIASKPDLLIVPFWVTYLVPPLRSIVSIVKRHAKTRVLFICHNVIPHDVGRMHLLLVKALLRKGEFAVVHSEQEKRLVEEAAPDIKVVKHSHPTYQFFAAGCEDAESAQLQRQSREELGIPEGKLVLLFFGFVRPYKGLDVLIRTMPAIRKRLDAALLVVGEFWEDRGPYDAMIDQLQLGDSVIVVDEYVPDNEVARYFASADVVILPYREATQSGVIQIAYGFRKPVITTDVGGLPEVVERGKTGYVVPPDDSEAVVDAVIRFDSDRLTIDFAANIEETLDRFSWSHLADLIEGLAKS